MVPLTGPGRGQLITHNLYQPEEMERIKAEASSGSSASHARSQPPVARAGDAEMEMLKKEMSDLRLLVEALSERLRKLEN